MSTTAYSVDSNVCQVYPSATGGDVLIYNEGPETVYANENAVAGGSGGFPIEPTGNIAREADVPLFLTCPTGVSRVHVTQDVTSALPLQSMASNIADGITGGTTITNQGIADAIYNRGVVAVDRPVLLASGSSVTSSPGGALLLYPSSGPVADVSGYAGLYLTMLSVVPTLGFPLAMLPVDVIWYLDSSGLIPMYTDRHYLAAQTGSSYSRIKVKSPYVKLRVQDSGTAAVCEYTWGLYGTNSNLSDEMIRSTNPNIGAGTIAPHDGSYKTVRISQTCTLSATTAIHFTGYGGRAMYSFSMPSATLGYSASIFLMDGTLVHYFNKAAGDVRQEPIEVILPAAPMQVRVSLGAEAADRSFGGTLVMEGKF